jgi:uncharacterized membrane protein YeaQ/YmgE (transglycosylase-associated protein family)
MLRRRTPDAHLRSSTVEGMLLVLLAVLIVLLIVLPIIGLALWTLISVAIVGIIIGGLARLVLPGRQNVGVMATILLGWIGSILGGFLGYRVIGTGRFPTVLLEIAVAAVLIALYSGSTFGNLPGRRQLRRW